MLLSTVVVSEFMTNCFIVADDSTHEAIVIDPGGEAHRIIQEIEKMDVRVKAVVNTHAHVDHIGASKRSRILIMPRSCFIISNSQSCRPHQKWADFSA